jgi:NAD(P)-dependent dehydrogenase (short-subunit alcohol dehydrogenase family)
MTRGEYFATAAAVGLVAGAAVLSRSRQRYGFDGRTALVFGGSRGLGLEIARVLGAEGAYVAIAARDEQELARAAEDLRGRGVHVLTLRCDVSDRADVERAMRDVVEGYGRLDVLVNDAGVIQVGPVEHMTIDDYETAMNVHFRGPLYAMLAAIPHMRAHGGGRIVNIASIGGKVPVPHLAPYAASKFALVGLSSSLRTELARHDILVTTVSPGLMRTGSPINATVKGQHEREFAWFAVSDSLPGLSMNSTRAARQIVEACRSGRAELILTLPARVAVALYGLMPSTFVEAAALANRLLPGATGPHGDRPRLGRDSTSAIAPSALTRLSDRAAERNNETIRPDPDKDRR